MSFQLTVNDRLQAALLRAARETGQDPQEMLSQAIVEYLEDLEDIRDGEAVLERVHSGQEAVYSPEEAKRWLGLDI